MKRQGSILMLAIIYLFLLQILAVAFVRILPVESRAALRSEESVTASLVAEAGVTEALAWLRAQLQPPDGSASREPLHPSVYPSSNQRTAAMGPAWSYGWSLVADAETYPNGSVPIRGYTVVARAYHHGVVCREARAQVIQEALTKYAALYDQWPDNLVMGIESTDAPQGGPVHVNDVTRLWIKDGSSYWSSSGQPFFSHGLTASGVYNAVGPGQDGFAYYQGNWSGS
ncbi:MAG: hypothetical protein KC910_29075, partial [Candidatus Eremiobacteraeota bacterium]|nr:hypothetical protein [Candidatus Eremiobacteraeota bacterium]